MSPSTDWYVSALWLVDILKKSQNPPGIIIEIETGMLSATIHLYRLTGKMNLLVK